MQFQEEKTEDRREDSNIIIRTLVNDIANR